MSDITLTDVYWTEGKHLVDDPRCPECEGANLTSDGMHCFDCEAADYE